MARQKLQMKEIDPTMYEQVFEGTFVDSKLRFFTPHEVKNVFDKEVNFLDPQEGHTYIIGADFAVAQSYTVFMVLDVTQDDSWYLVHMERFKGEKHSPDYQLALLADLSKTYNMAEIVFDASSLAGPFIEYSNLLDDLYTYDEEIEE